MDPATRCRWKDESCASLPAGKIGAAWGSNWGLAWWVIKIKTAKQQQRKAVADGAPYLRVLDGSAELQAHAEALNTAAGATGATQLTSSPAEVVTPAPGRSRHRTGLLRPARYR